MQRNAVVIEDDPEIRQLLEEILTSAGFSVIAVSNGIDGVRAVAETSPEITTVDVSMPGIDGFETTRRIRQVSDSYVFFITARSDEIDVLQGLEIGADDFITKPFRPRELRARIDAMLRRPRAMGVAAEAESPAEPSGEDWLRHNGLEVSPGQRRVFADGVEIELTRSEFNLLLALMQSGSRVRGKAELAELLRGDGFTGYFIGEHDKRAVEVHVANLRKKLGENTSVPRWIETVRGVGYRLTPPRD